MRKAISRIDDSLHKPWSMAAAMAAVFLLWNTPVLAPLKILVVFFHEIGHGIGAVLTGGHILSLKVWMNESGRACSYGGSRFIMLNAGYLGSFVIGSLLILVAAFFRRDRILSALLGAALGVITLLYVRNLTGFIFGLAVAAGFIAAAKYLSHASNDFLFKVVGVTSCCYAVLDIWSDVFVWSSCRSDAVALSRMTYVPSYIWGALWIALSLTGTWYTLKLAARLDKGESWGR